jgi:hypothetical protein
MKAALARAATLGLLTVRSAADAMVGTNIGGWMVLEPWITPSLFYRFLGNSRSQGVGMDRCTLACWQSERGGCVISLEFL